MEALGTSEKFISFRVHQEIELGEAAMGAFRASLVNIKLLASKCKTVGSVLFLLQTLILL